MKTQVVESGWKDAFDWHIEFYQKIEYTQKVQLELLLRYIQH